MPLVERARAPRKPRIGRLRSLDALLESPAHDFRPFVALRLRHPVRHEQLEDAGSQSRRDREAALSGGDDANGWRECVCGTVQVVVLRCCDDGVFEGDSRRGGEGLETQVVKRFLQRTSLALPSVPRSLVIGNGNVLVGFDANYSVRDIYFPRVGDATQTMGNLCRTGFFVDGKFAWLYDDGWDRKLGYVEDSLVTDVTLKNARLGISVKFGDYVDLARNWFIRNVEVTSASGFNVGRVFFHYDWYIEGSEIGNTVAYDPRHRGVIAYKGNRYFLIRGH